jgi:transposase
MRRFYNQQHRFYGGVDRHARTLSLCILEAAGTVVCHDPIAASPAAFLKVVKPFRDGLVVACACLVAWYGLADRGHEEASPVVLGHALYLKAIHGGKAKTAKIDAQKIAVLLRGGLLPQAYVYPKGLRETRDRLRRRTDLVRRRAEALAHLVNTHSPYNHPPLATQLADAANRQELDRPARFPDPSVTKNVAVDLALIASDDEHSGALEVYLTRAAKVDDAQACARLRSVPGVGPVLGLVLLYEIHDSRRFAEEGPFLSSARLVRCAHASAGTKQGTGGPKIGNAHLQWAFAEATCLLRRARERAQAWRARRETKHGTQRALGALAARLGRAVYHLLRKGAAFDAGRFCAS